MRNVTKALGLFALTMTIGACSKGGQLTLEPNARIVKTRGNPFITVNQGGKALVVQQGQTPDTGVHGWVAIQTHSAKQISSGDGHTIILNQNSAIR